MRQGPQEECLAQNHQLRSFQGNYGRYGAFVYRGHAKDIQHKKCEQTFEPRVHCGPFGRGRSVFWLQEMHPAPGHPDSQKLEHKSNSVGAIQTSESGTTEEGEASVPGELNPKVVEYVKELEKNGDELV
jgi:hypothetical protein